VCVERETEEKEGNEGVGGSKFREAFSFSFLLLPLPLLLFSCCFFLASLSLMFVLLLCLLSFLLSRPRPQPPFEEMKFRSVNDPKTNAHYYAAAPSSSPSPSPSPPSSPSSPPIHRFIGLPQRLEFSIGSKGTLECVCNFKAKEGGCDTSGGDE